MDSPHEPSSSDAEGASTIISSRKKAPSSRKSGTPSTSKHEALPDSETTSTATENPTRHEKFWFHDGSVILQVESKLFRVHQTILANHSEVFASLFEVPQPAGEFSLEGCPIVVLHDNENDFEDLLHAVYNPSYFENLPRSADVETTLTFIQGILRLSTKYIIRNLRHRCITRLTSKFPCTFDDYCAKSVASTHERFKSDVVMRAINIARESNVPTILPYAYYCVARMSMRRLMNEREGDLGWKDKCQCMVGRERLRWAEMSISYSFLILFERSQTCHTLTCAHTRGPHAEWHILEAAKSPNPLRAYSRWNLLNVCKDCEVHCQERHLAGRKQVWEQLPGLFGLVSWEALAEQQNMG